MTEGEQLYQATRRPVWLSVPAMTFVMVDGRGDPNGSAFYAEAVQVLYTLSFAARLALKKEIGLVHKVGPLEGLWWAEDMVSFGVGDKLDWLWTAMIAEPEELTPERFSSLLDEVGREKTLPGLARARLATFTEGLVAQVLHEGPYWAEQPTIEALHAFIRAEGRSFDGRVQKHHEIYLSDPRRTAPEKCRTIVRQPVSDR